MRYLYKIYSPYDGFFPARIPDRLEDGRFLTLGWARYLDALHLGDEVWIVFTGPRFENGVYVEGLVAGINPNDNTVRLRVRRKSTRAPLTDAQTSAELKDAVKTRYRQVFLWPADRLVQPECHAADCGKRKCLQCDLWRGLPQIEPADYRNPAALRGLTVVPAYWSVPPRCYLYYGGRQVAPWNRRVTDMFSAFKIGEGRFAYPFAAGINEALRSRGEQGFDAIVPIPLSPEKAEAGELDRTAAIAGELSKLNGVPVRSLLSLSNPISKRRMITQGFTPTQFKNRYRQYLTVDPAIAEPNRILIVDDAITKGSTLSVAVDKIRATTPNVDIVVASAVQMIVKEVVANDNGPAW